MNRLWNVLGFRERHPERSHMEGDARFAPGAIVTHARAHLGLWDRIRLLVSGRLVVSVRIITDVPVGLAITRSAFSICRPGEPL
jgi:hypothetical protein